MYRYIALKYFILCGFIIPFLDFSPKKLLEAFPDFNMNVLVVVIFVIIKVVRCLSISEVTLILKYMYVYVDIINLIFKFFLRLEYSCIC